MKRIHPKPETGITRQATRGSEGAGKIEYFCCHPPNGAAANDNQTD